MPPDTSSGTDAVPAAIRMALAIDIEQLWMSYDGQAALQGLSLQAYEGEIVGLIGPNGAGKTTTLKILVGLLRPDYGVVRVNGHDVIADPVAYKADIGYMPESPTLPEYLTPAEFLGYVGRIRDLPKERIAARTSELLAFLDLAPKADETIASLSKGMKAKIAFAAAILHEPHTLILDEPLIGIDPAGGWHGPRVDAPARHRRAAVQARCDRPSRTERRDGRPRSAPRASPHRRGGEPRGDLPPPHGRSPDAAGRSAAASIVVPEVVRRGTDARPVHIQVAVLLWALPPRPFRPARVRGPHPDFHPLERRDRDHDGRHVAVDGHDAIRRPSVHTARGSPVARAPLLARTRRHGPCVRVRFLHDSEGSAARVPRRRSPVPVRLSHRRGRPRRRRRGPDRKSTRLNSSH